MVAGFGGGWPAAVKERAHSGARTERGYVRGTEVRAIEFMG
jgi:hypothetical protein